ncbi:M48 family metallopeptidase [Candidatus Woesebacteria bacterium]|nr:M48 family metallopeptidase [Candidatus Woesebacteria bacterium]
MLNIYEQIDSNKRRSWLIIGLFIGFVSAFGYFFSYIYGYDWSFMIGAILISGVGSWVSYYNSDTIALSLAGAHPVTHKTHHLYFNVVENLSTVARIPKPKIYLIDSPALNAFATGRDPEHGAIAVTQGLLDTLTRTELEGVVAHELSHIKNFDTRLMTIVAILVGSIAMILNWSWRISWHKGSDNNDKNSNAIVMVIGLIFIILAPIIAQLIQLAISRRREFYADASASQITRQPSGLINALKKIASHEDIQLETANTATAHLYIDDPVTSETHGTWMAKLFSTHPPIAERIRALEGKV